ncbi:LuxR family transcriptional regulator [Streptomyces rubiginosohelvolus]|uniref:LuxR family transcriptional regulator n=1 Tax=Streptomyces rubiginosohelvolus TaxID=67362 RepID=UPI003713C980
MDEVKVAEALRGLGIGADAVRVYLVLLRMAPASLSAVGAAAELEGEHLAVAYGELVDVGLACGAVGEDDLAAPVPPGVALKALTRRRAAEADASGITVAGAFEAFRRLRLAAHNEDLVDVVTGEDVGRRARQAWAGARERIRQFDTPPYYSVGSGTGVALDSLGRGVTQRVVYSRASLELPGNLAANIEPCIAAGEEARVLPSLPVKLIIIDDAYALVSLSIADVDVHNTMLVVQPCGLFSALVALFEQTWQQALPFPGAPGPSPSRLPPAERRLLALLAGGVSDDDIALEMGISRRTLSRRIEVLMARVGASTRFQMALQIHRRGWL